MSTGLSPGYPCFSSTTTTATCTVSGGKRLQTHDETNCALSRMAIMKHALCEHVQKKGFDASQVSSERLHMGNSRSIPMVTPFLTLLSEYLNDFDLPFIVQISRARVCVCVCRRGGGTAGASFASKICHRGTNPDNHEGTAFRPSFVPRLVVFHQKSDEVMPSLGFAQHGRSPLCSKHASLHKWRWRCVTIALPCRSANQMLFSKSRYE